MTRRRSTPEKAEGNAEKDSRADAREVAGPVEGFKVG